MIRRLAAAVLSAVVLLSAAAGAVSAADNGNCSTDGHWIAGKQPQVSNISGIWSQIDPANGSALCSNPGLAYDNGVFDAITISPNDPISGVAPQLSFGVVMCDVPVTNGCDAGSRGTWHYWINNVDCTPGHFDHQVDLGTANSPWGDHDYKLEFHYASKQWHYFLDGNLVYSVDTNSPSVFSCFDMNDPNNDMQGGWQSERWDLGDGWSSPGVYTWFNAMLYYRSGWTIPSTVACNFNNHPSAPHAQYCNASSYSNMRLWTIY